MSTQTIDAAKASMEKSVAALEVELQKLRTGRAQPSLLDHVMVDYYGNPTPVKQVANVSVEDSRTLTVSPWEQAMVTTIEKAIRDSDLGLNPATAGQVIRIPLPPLTEDRRRDMTRLVREEGERSKVAIRNVRRDANHDLKQQEQDKLITEDDVRRFGQTIQKLTDDMIVKVDALVSKKEKELLQV